MSLRGVFDLGICYPLADSPLFPTTDLPFFQICNERIPTLYAAQSSIIA